MARPLRIEFAGALYHVTARDNARGDIYLEDSDRREFLDILHRTCEQFNWHCHAYCLMSNHYHLLVETGDATLSKGMRHLNGTYTQWFNRSRGRVGHLLQGRFKAILVQKEAYLLELARYIVLNPVRARMVLTAQEWPWSSYRATAGLAAPLPCLTCDWILQSFGQRRREAFQAYRQFIARGRNQPAPWQQLKNQIYLGSDQFIEAVQTEMPPDSKLTEVPRAQRLRPMMSLSHYAERWPDRNEAMARAWRDGHYTFAQIGKHFGVGKSTVGRAVKAFSGKWEI